MPRGEITTLRSMLQAAGDLTGRFFSSGESRISLGEIVAGSVLHDRAAELRGRSVLMATTDDAVTAAALVELDGIAGRLVLCPSHLPSEYLPFVLDVAAVDAIVSDGPVSLPSLDKPPLLIPCSRSISPAAPRPTVAAETEWILLTSGTTGRPKLVSHTLASLTGAIRPGRDDGKDVVWSPLFDLRRFGGIQVFFRAVASGSSLVLSSPSESTAEFLSRMAALGATHICGTPSQWRTVLMSSAAGELRPRYIRLGGEIADDGILSSLRLRFPDAEIVHSFASTEAGVAFVVRDGHAGFPVSVLEGTPHVEMKIREQTLCIRSSRTARRYLGESAPALKDAENFVDTGDLIEIREQRCFFIGRRDGIINIGGLKVSPEEIEATINRHPGVHMSLVRAKKSRITGAIVVADVVLREPGAQASRDALRKEILLGCERLLAAKRIPAIINFVPSLAVNSSGKLLRN